MRIIRVLVLLTVLAAGLLATIGSSPAQTPPPANGQQTTPPQPAPPAQATPPGQSAPPTAAPATPGQPPAPPAQPAAAAPPAPPPPPPAPPTLDVDGDLKRTVESIERIEKEITSSKDNESALGSLRGQVEGVMYESTQINEKLKPRLADVRNQIEKLGPAPKEGPEAGPVAAERARLNALATAIDGAIKTTELTWVRARQQIERITDLRHEIFAQSLYQRRPSPLSLALWRDVWSDMPSVLNTLSYIGSSWVEEAKPKSATVFLIFLLSGALYMGLRYTFRIATASRQRPRAKAPPFFERTTAATWYAPMRAIAPVFAALLLFVGLDSLDILHYWADRVLWAFVKAVLIFAAIAAIVAAVMAPRESDWRLVPLNDHSSAQISGVLQGIAGVYAADLALAEISRWLTLTVSVSVLQTIIANMVLASLFVCVLMTPFSRLDANGVRASRLYPIWFKGPIWIAVIAIVATTFMGYVAMGRFIAHQLVLTGVVIVVTGLLYLAIRSLTREPQEAGLAVTDILETRFGLDAPRRQTLARLTELALSLLLLMLAVPFILLQWGFSGEDIRDWFRSVFFGFDIGRTRISPANIVLGIALFIALVLATRMFQRWLRDMMLTPARMDPGIAHSIDTVVGYAGTALAGLVAVSYAGFDITNLAILAGALSVGIGFGLQSIVNNFVSGLILLFERPVKVGDWIVVGGDEGIVRRISVRSTEIETFDRSSVVLPNSELIMGRVKNWTLRDAVGRTKITFTVRYDLDPAKARDIALAIAQRHPDVLKSPSPYVAFDAFSGDSATLTLNVFVGDVTRGGRTKSQISFELLKALPEAGIALVPTATSAGTDALEAAGPVPFTISIPVGYDGDPGKVRTIMLEAAARVEGVAKSPAPLVNFDAFDGDGMKLTLQAHAASRAIADAVRTELALSVHSAMRTAGVENPTHRHNVRLQDLEPIRQAITAAMEERRRGARTSDGTT
jgi:potassium efflux system protein